MESWGEAGAAGVWREWNAGGDVGEDAAGCCCHESDAERDIWHGYVSDCRWWVSPLLIGCMMYKRSRSHVAGIKRCSWYRRTEGASSRRHLVIQILALQITSAAPECRTCRRILLRQRQNMGWHLSRLYDTPHLDCAFILDKSSYRPIQRRRKLVASISAMRIIKVETNPYL